MKAVAAIANAAWLASSLPAWRRYRRALCDPAGTQARILRNLLAANAASAYGREYRFQEIRSWEQFRERVPVVDYDDLQTWIQRIMRGEDAVLTQAPVTRLIPTSGSSGARKLIPFTAALQREFNAAIGPWMVDLALAHPTVPLGPSYWSISPALPDSGEESAVPIGFDDDSGYLGGIRRRLVESTLAVPSTLRLISDTDDFRYLTLLCLLRSPELSLISIWHPSFLTVLLDALPAMWDELMHDIASGGCRRAAALPPEVRRGLQAPPDPRRAHTLRQSDPADLRTLWPALRVVSCWGDGQAAGPLADLQRRLPHAFIQTKGLLATEAFITIPFRSRHPVAITSHFYEFADPSGKIHLTHELRSGETYSVIVTTAGGLWRYSLGDLVEVDGFVEGTPSLRFLGRGNRVSDLCGEKLSEAFVTTAIRKACASFGLAPSFAMLAPEHSAEGPPFYTLFIEGEVHDLLATRLDDALRENPHYAWCRDLGQLGPVQCCVVAERAYDRFCEAALANGQRLGDIKPQALSTRTDWRITFGI
ncbi:MAG: GH3 auxin-responsive promoter family protein [Chthoniobacteraceae bacterium]